MGERGSDTSASSAAGGRPSIENRMSPARECGCAVTTQTHMCSRRGKTSEWTGAAGRTYQAHPRQPWHGRRKPGQPPRRAKQAQSNRDQVRGIGTKETWFAPESPVTFPLIMEMVLPKLVPSYAGRSTTVLWRRFAAQTAWCGGKVDGCSGNDDIRSHTRAGIHQWVQRRRIGRVSRGCAIAVCKWMAGL